MHLGAASEPLSRDALVGASTSSSRSLPMTLSDVAPAVPPYFKKCDCAQQRRPALGIHPKSLMITIPVIDRTGKMTHAYDDDKHVF